MYSSYELQLFCINIIVGLMSAATVYRHTGSDRYRTDGVY